MARRFFGRTGSAHFEADSSHYFSSTLPRLPTQLRFEGISISNVFTGVAECTFFRTCFQLVRASDLQQFIGSRKIIPTLNNASLTTPQRKMKLVICILVLVVSITASTALTQGEKEAISALYDEWSDLRLAHPPWTSNSSAACDEPPFQYITCTDGPDPHVSSLYEPFCKKSLKQVWFPSFSLCSSFRPV